MLNAAIVGLGRYAERLVASVQGQSDKLRFVAAATRPGSDGSAFAQRFGIGLAPDFGAVLARPDVQAVVLATPHSLHAEQVEQAARAGKHVFVEKPYTLTRESAEHATAACRASGVTLAVGFNSRFHPALVELRRLASSGALGTILHVEGQISGPPASAGSREAGHWRTLRTEHPAGGMTGKGIHLVDLMISLCGPVGSVFAHSERRAIGMDMDDVTAMLFRFRGGASGYLSTLLATAPCWRLQVLGTAGWAEVRELDTLTVRTLDGKPQERRHEASDTRRAELEAFADAVAGVAPYPVTPEEAIAGSAALEAVDQSARSRLEVRLA